MTFFQVMINYIVAVWTKKDKDDQQDSIYFDYFWISIIFIMIFSILRPGSIFLSLLISSINLHKRIVWKLLRAPCSFIDSNPIGRILTRFAKDTVVLDYFLAFVLNIASIC